MLSSSILILMFNCTSSASPLCYLFTVFIINIKNKLIIVKVPAAKMLVALLVLSFPLKCFFTHSVLKFHVNNLNIPGLQ